ncbi:MAG: molybdate ABC transporter substrate-binding protein [Planctomycetota bacterium]|jgi:molybdate transport system substrate-binding protein
MRKEAVRALSLLLPIAAFLGCRAEPSDDADGRIVVFAAASTANAVDEVCQGFREKHGVVVQSSYAATSTLVHQIEMGAEADVLVSASEEWADHLEKGGHVSEKRNLLGNCLVVIVPADSDIKVNTPNDLLDPRVEHLAVADPEAVPAGIYAKQALVSLGLWQRLKGRLAAGAHVRQALSFVETGAAEAGIVYATDAAISEAIEVAVALEPDLTEPIRYPVVLLKSGSDREVVRRFLDYLSSPEGAAVFRKLGFTVLTDEVASVP